MTSIVVDGIEYIPRRQWRRKLRAAYVQSRDAVTLAAQVAGTIATAKAKLLRRHVQEHLYSFAAAACFDAAWFTHSVFTGLLFTSLSLVVLELKVSGKE